MKNNGHRKDTVPPARNEPTASGLHNGSKELPLFSGVEPSISKVVEAIRGFSGGQAGLPEKRQTKTPLFAGTNIAELVKTFKAVQKSPSVSDSKTLDITSQAKAIPLPRLSAVRTAEVIESLLNVKRNKRVQESTLETYIKHYRHFEKRFPFLPLDAETITEYLSQFKGETGRHRHNIQGLLKMLYQHAVRRFGLAKNPVDELELPLVTKKPIKTLTLDQVRKLIRTPQTPMESAALDLLLGHGWRQIEVRRVSAADVNAIENDLILCRGKERQELAPILPETATRLKELAAGLKPEDPIFRAQQTRHGRRAALGADGISQMIGRFFELASIKGFKGHDLRRTFSTLVTRASGDDHLAMRLLRDSVSSLTNRYVRYPLELLVEALLKYSPLRQAGEENTSRNPEAKVAEIVDHKKSSPVSETGEEAKTAQIEPDDGLVETGEG